MLFRNRFFNAVLGLCAYLLLSGGAAQAAIISFSSADFTTTPTFNLVETFAFSIDIVGPLTPGASYINPALNVVDYSVSGTLPILTPSMFPAFALVRTVGGAEFYAQGGSFMFEIAAAADLSDGLQLSELVGIGPVFTFNAREVGTPRFHPPIIVLNSDGTGLIQNSNNEPNGNPINAGDEYITDLSFNPATLTIAAAQVPEPGTLTLCMIAFAALAAGRRRLGDRT